MLRYNPSADHIKAVPKKRNGVGLVSSSSRTEIPKQNRPPKIKEANYRLYHFLIERFPNSGICHTASREKDPASTEDLKAFVDFCKRKEYSTHPYSAKWLEMLDRPRPLVAILAPNIRVYQSCNKRITYPPSSRPGGHFTEIIFEIGPCEPLAADNKTDIAE